MPPDLHPRSGLQIGGEACAVDEQRGEEQRNVAETGRRHDSQTAQGACQVPGAQPGATTQTLAYAAHADGRSSGADREKTVGRPEKRLEPSISSASSAPTVIPAARPAPLKIYASSRIASVRRCSGGSSSTLVPAETAGESLTPGDVAG